MGNAPTHTPNRGFKLPIVFPNKRNLFGVLSLSRFQHKRLKTLPCVFSVLCRPPGCNSRHTSHPRMGQVGRITWSNIPAPSQSLWQERTGGARGCLRSHAVPEQPVPCQVPSPPGDTKLVLTHWGGSLFPWETPWLRASVPRFSHAALEVPCQAVNFLAPASTECNLYTQHGAFTSTNTLTRL